MKMVDNTHQWSIIDNDDEFQFELFKLYQNVGLVLTLMETNCVIGLPKIISSVINIISLPLKNALLLNQIGQFMELLY